jgi:TRAP-type mannitol/chloroaromatic compound transport system substrate-binding protein
VQLRQLPGEVLAQLKHISEQLLAGMAAEDPQIAEVYRSLRAFQDNVKQYHRISEQAYLQARDQPEALRK